MIYRVSPSGINKKQGNGVSQRALYRKYRSTSLDEVVGQDHITGLLKNALKTDRVAHAYLFTGPRGVGKTSIARILAYEINKLPYSEDSQNLDIIEIDAASNNGVEDVRDLREKVQIAPVAAKKKIYIIDEVHMLSKQAFNALLKTLEEPPEHIVFILATTDINKLPATIISRTQHYGFRLIKPEVAAAHLKTIAEAEGLKIDDDALMLVARRGQGSFRDSISLLDQISSLRNGSGAISTAMIEESLGLASNDHIKTLLSAYSDGDVKAIVEQLDMVTAEGVSSVVFAGQVIDYVRSVIAESPNLMSLLDNLLDVPKSSHPDIKLLTVLAGGQTLHTPTQKPKNVALAAPVQEIRASVDSIKKQIKTEEVAEKVGVASSKSETQPSATPKENATPKESADDTEDTAAASEESSVTKKPSPSAASTDFNWEALVEHVRQNFVALYSVLSKCTPEIDGNEIKLYTNNAFYKKKLDDTKYSTSLYESIQALGMPALDIITIPERPPLKDSQASAIADIMGGGVEVALS